MSHFRWMACEYDDTKSQERALSLGLRWVLHQERLGVLFCRFRCGEGGSFRGASPVRPSRLAVVGGVVRNDFRCFGVVLG